MPAGLAAAVQGLMHPTAFQDTTAGDTFELREYYAAACPHCKHMTPAWEAAASQYSGPVKFRAIECADEEWKPVDENKDLCENIMGFPTIKMFNGEKEVGEFEGARTTKDFVDYAKSFETAASIKPASMGEVSLLFASIASYFQPKAVEKPKKSGRDFL